MINCGQNVKLEKEFIEFKNFNRQTPAPFKIYADFKCWFVLSILKPGDMSIEKKRSRKCQDHIPRSFAYKVVCVDDKFSKDAV